MIRAAKAERMSSEEACVPVAEGASTDIRVLKSRIACCWRSRSRGNAELSAYKRAALAIKRPKRLYERAKAPSMGGRFQ
jgi:hypothetical protein